MSAEQLDASEAQEKPGEQPEEHSFTLTYDPKTQVFTPRMVGDIPLAGLLMQLSAIYFQLMMTELTKASLTQMGPGGKLLGSNGMPLPPSIGNTFFRRRQN